MGRPKWPDVVPTVVLHLVAAGVNVAAAMALGLNAAGVLSAGLAAAALGGPVVGLSLGVAGKARTGALLLLISYVATAGLGVYSLLGMGSLRAALAGPPGNIWRPVFFFTAAALPLLQIKGILEVAPSLLPEAAEEEHEKHSVISIK
jgi:hypothetical protein